MDWLVLREEQCTAIVPVIIGRPDQPGAVPDIIMCSPLHLS
jgi:hypothetical protein